MISRSRGCVNRQLFWGGNESLSAHPGDLYFFDMPIRLTQGVEYSLSKQILVKDEVVIRRHIPGCEDIERGKELQDTLKAAVVMYKHLKVKSK